jgi:2-dehydro-3-deoxyphosphooctonate aldolase (KDO 8-P synthase)
MHLCDHAVGGDQGIFIIADPCVIESEAIALSVAETLAISLRGSIFC